MPEPIPVRVVRHKCPHCGRTHSAKKRCVEHMARCWLNPEARGCKTCKHFDRYGLYDTYGDECQLGVDLEGRPACENCKGMGWLSNGLFDGRCPACGGNAEAIMPGPIIGCEKWELWVSGDGGTRDG